jgi:hypothetical protein
LGGVFRRSKQGLRTRRFYLVASTRKLLPVFFFMPLSTPAVTPTRATSTAPAADLAAAKTLPYSLPDLVCFAHLHWDFVWQRPQHLLSRFAQQGRVFYIEDAFFHADDHIEPHVEVKERQNGVKVVVVHLPNHLRHDEAASDQAQFGVLSKF